MAPLILFLAVLKSTPHFIIMYDTTTEGDRVLPFSHITKTVPVFTKAKAECERGVFACS